MNQPSIEGMGTVELRALTADLGGRSLFEQAPVPGLDPAALVEAADGLLSAADGPALVEALDRNLQLWVAIKTTTANEEGPLPETVRQNLRTLAGLIADITLAAGQRSLESREIEGLAGINLDIARGLAEGERQRLVRDRAYELWDRAGRPDNRSLEFWLAAEREIDEAVDAG